MASFFRLLQRRRRFVKTEKKEKKKRRHLNAIIFTSGKKKVPKYFFSPAKAGHICQILRRLISQYCTMNILIKNGGDGGRRRQSEGGHVEGF